MVNTPKRITAIEIAAQEPPKEVAISKEYQRHKRVFSEEESQRFPPSRPWDHEIKFLPGAPKTMDCKVYLLNQIEDQALLEFLKEELKKGYIKPSKAPYALPFFFIKKKDGKLRPVQDYRKINEWTIPDRYPLPLIPELISQVKGTKIFTKFDVQWGYNNVRMKEGDEEKAAFKTRYGLYEPRVMYFGLRNSPSTFQSMMNGLFAKVQDYFQPKGMEIVIYMDDILVATRTSMEDHHDTVHCVLWLLKYHDLYLKPSKCTWEQEEVDYLGLIIGKGNLRMDLAKVKVVTEWPTLKKLKDVRSFLGFCNFYRPFIEKFSQKAGPLHLLTKKEQKWQWGKEQAEAMELLKETMTKEPVLGQLDEEEPFEVEVDASGFAIGAVLLQRGKDKKRHPIAYYLATLTATERNYDVYDRELLAIVKTLRNWQMWLAGAKHQIKIFSDHMNLQYWKDLRKISRRIAREVLELSKYDFEIRHLPGNANGRADALSRRADYNQGEEDNEDITVLLKELFAYGIQIDPVLPRQDWERIKEWKEEFDLQRIDGTWYKEGKRVVTGPLEDRRGLIAENHDPPTKGHPGILRTIQAVERNYWWPNM